MIKFKRIFMDPGHGGEDSGTYNSTIKAKESDVALKVAKEVRKLFTSKKRKFKFSRKIDKKVELNSRWRKARDWNADLVLCIHCNSWKDKSVRGTEVWHYGENDKHLAEVLSSKISKSLGVPNRGRKEHGFAMTYYPTMPAVLIEIDFISNDDFAKQCKKKEYIKQIAKAIYDGVRAVENEK